MIELTDRNEPGARIKVIGVGGGGGNAINTMVSGRLEGVEFIAANTDVQALAANKASVKIQLGRAASRGLGAGANPDRGREAALEAREEIADEVLLNAVQGISDLITVHGLVNVDFADVRTIMSEQGMALMGTGRSAGARRSVEAMQAAISSPLLEDVTIDGATGLLVNITGGPSLTLHEVNEAVTMPQTAYFTSC